VEAAMQIPSTMTDMRIVLLVVHIQRRTSPKIKKNLQHHRRMVIMQPYKRGRYLRQHAHSMSIHLENTMDHQRTLRNTSILMDRLLE
jgi:hypothetical protein